MKKFKYIYFQKSYYFCQSSMIYHNFNFFIRQDFCRTKSGARALLVFIDGAMSSDLKYLLLNYVYYLSHLNLKRFWFYELKKNVIIETDINAPLFVLLAMDQIFLHFVFKEEVVK